jgi:hypothetical protein
LKQLSEFSCKNLSSRAYRTSPNAAEWSSLVAGKAHNLEVVGSNPTPATNLNISCDALTGAAIRQNGGDMTTLVAWVSYPKSKKNISGIYLASDSRITWGSANRRWDAGRKLFTSDKSAHAFGYCGDVVFPSLVLAQVISALDQKQIFEEDVSPNDKHMAVVSVIKSSFERRHNAPNQSFTIVHTHRDGSGDAACFRL